MLDIGKPISYSEDHPPQLIVVIDTEEEFDWSAMPKREAIAVTAIREVGRFQEIFDEYQLRPCYVVDYPIASQEEGVQYLKPILDSGRCEIGTHLHPWVNPPFEEELTRSNMYPGNLGFDLEKAKLKCITDTIHENFKIQPQIYKAGRYGLGKNTAKIMKELGYSIDLSVCSAFDYRADGGPDFSNCSAEPYWFGENNELLEIPLSGAFVGYLGTSMARRIYAAAGYFNKLKARGILSRLNLVDRLMLSPEDWNCPQLMPCRAI